MRRTNVSFFFVKQGGKCQRQKEIVQIKSVINRRVAKLYPCKRQPSSGVVLCFFFRWDCLWIWHLSRNVIIISFLQYCSTIAFAIIYNTIMHCTCSKHSHMSILGVTIMFGNWKVHYICRKFESQFEKVFSFRNMDNVTVAEQFLVCYIQHLR